MTVDTPPLTMSEEDRRLIEDHRPDARFRRLRVAARSRLVWSAVVLAAGIALGMYFSADANPEAAAAVHNLSADATALRPYDSGTLSYVSGARKANIVGFTYEQRSIADLRLARAHFTSEFARLGYRAAGTDRGKTFVRDRYCRGMYQASATNDTTEPTTISISFDWGDGVQCR